MSLASLLMPEGELAVIRCETADKLIQCGDGDAALLYLYVIRRGAAFDEAQAMRELHLSKERFDRASFTLTGLVIAQPPTPAELTPPTAPRYTAAELREVRSTNHHFAAICDTAESILGRPLTETLLRTLYTVYDFMALPADVIIELLSYLGRDRGSFRGRDVEREACIWADKRILTIADAQRYLAEVEAEKPLRQALFQALGVVGRTPTTPERALVKLCLEKHFPPETVSLAMSRMRRNIGEFSASYLRKMLGAWDQKGVHTVAEITALEPEIARKSGSNSSDAQSTPSDQLADWEKTWLAELKRRRAKQQEG